MTSPKNELNLFKPVMVMGLSAVLVVCGAAE
jgi:hypothetical protein